MAQNDAQLLAALQAAHEAGDEDAAIAIAHQLNATPVQAAPNPADKPGGANWNAKYGPTAGMTEPQKFAAGMGQSVYDTGRGLSQIFGGMTPEKVDAQRKQDAPLDESGAGMLGNMAGSVMQAVAVPGSAMETAAAKLAGTTPQALAKASTVYRAMRPVTEGAAWGAEAPVGTGETRGKNAMIGGGAGGIGGALGLAGNTLARTDAISAGAQKGAAIAQKYGVPLSMPDLAGGKMAWVQSVLDKLPFSGAEDRINAQRAAFNTALGKTAGIAPGPVTQDAVYHAMDNVGGQIGSLASSHAAVPTTKNVADFKAILQDARDNATPENYMAVTAKIKQLLAHVDPATNTIPGDAWRQANTALGRQIRSTTDGDLKHYLGMLQEPYMDMMEQGMSPQAMDAFQQLRGQYRNLKTIEPLAEKAGNVSTEGVNPTLVQQRAIAAGNTQGPVKELGDFAKTYLTKKYPDSGTAQRALLYGTLGGLGIGANEWLGGDENHQHAESAGAGVLPALVGEIGGGLAGRAMASRALSKLYTSQLPEAASQVVHGVTDNLPIAATRAEEVQRGEPSAPDQTMADGGQPDPQYKKSTFWDLVQQAIKEATGGNNGMVAAPRAASPVPGENATGPVGNDFDNRINAAVSANE